MVSDTVQTKICTCCDRRREITDFRRFRRGSEERHSQCNQCRRTEARLKREQADRQQIVATMRELRRDQTLERMSDFIDELAHQFGGKNQLIATWAELLNSENTPISFQLKTANTLMHVAVCVDLYKVLHELKVLESETPLDACRKMHKSGRLFDGLREMYLRYDFELRELMDAVDPPY